MSVCAGLWNRHERTILKSTSVILALFALQAEAHLGEYSDSGIQGPTYGEIEIELGSLENSYPQIAKVYTYGKSVDGRNLKIIRIELPGKNLSAVPRPAILISGATHGNEFLHIEDRLPRWFLENREKSPGLAKFLKAAGVIYVIPIVNPDGYTNALRSNSHDVDLNRDFDLIPDREKNFKEPESKALAEFIHADLTARNLRLKLTVDYHCCADSLLFPWSYTNDNLPSADLLSHELIAKAMQTYIDPTYISGATGQVLGYNPRGTSKDYYYARYGTLSFTFEGSYGVEHQKFIKHTRWWDHIFELMAD